MNTELESMIWDEFVKGKRPMAIYRELKEKNLYHYSRQRFSELLNKLRLHHAIRDLLNVVLREVRIESISREEMDSLNYLDRRVGEK